MKRRSKVSGKAARLRGPKASKSKRASPPRRASRPTSSAADKNDEVAWLTRELNEAREQQTATSEVLGVISSSPGDLAPVFTAMLEKAVRICEAKFGSVYRCEGGTFGFVAMHNAPPALAERARRSAFRPSEKHYFGPMLATKSVVQVADLMAEQGYIDRRAEYVASVELGGVRTYLMVPILKDTELIGAFVMGRQEVRPFTDKQIELVKNFAPRQSSQSRMRGCSTNCASALLTLQRRWSSRRQAQRCSRLSAVRLAICNRSLRAYSRMRRGFVKVISGFFLSMKVTGFSAQPRGTSYRQRSSRRLPSSALQQRACRRFALIPQRHLLAQSRRSNSCKRSITLRNKPTRNVIPSP
jgi:GAF domain